MDNIHLDSFVLVRKGKILRNDQVVFESTATGAEFLRQAYEEGLKIDYPRFYKMDPLGKLGIIATDTLLQGSAISQNHRPEEVAMVLCNHNASIEADTNYFETANTFPSPALFVYTLPNIVIGEISIRYNFKGENAFFIQEGFDAEWLYFYVNDLFRRQKTKACICGWIEAVEDQYDLCLFLVESNKTQKGLKFAPSELDRIYNGRV